MLQGQGRRHLHLNPIGIIVLSVGIDDCGLCDIGVDGVGQDELRRTGVEHHGLDRPGGVARIGPGQLLSRGWDDTPIIIEQPVMTAYRQHTMLRQSPITHTNTPTITRLA